MQITRQTEYAIHTVIELSKIPFGDVVQIKEIAGKHNIPETFLKKTVQALSKSGIVATHRGTNGGVRLARPSDSITLADVLVAIEGPLALNVCLEANYDCDNQSTCRIHEILKRTQNTILKELSKESFANIVSE
ncbi:RrF2 family transcriptional regulator [Desulfolucanica intricata]|uniref:RrF2 family transcriptional regulator n=1 Tax=Desulfolucanica intricata TaxID=1285191 RepID=UPI00082FFCE4|nr:Rrf2 family transcriptional regulator [Desulfolucanica intricata]